MHNKKFFLTYLGVWQKICGHDTVSKYEEDVGREKRTIERTSKSYEKVKTYTVEDSFICL